jgi:hypothetical protein
MFVDLPAGPPNSSLPDKRFCKQKCHPTLPEQLSLTELRKQRTSSVVIPVGTTGGSGEFLPATQMAVATKYQENLIRVDVFDTYTHEHVSFIPKNRD